MRSILGVEIFKAGMWKGRKFTLNDLKELVAAFSGLDFKPPIKLGHIWRAPDQQEPMAAGWVDNVRLDGEVIKADLVDLPDEVYDAVRQRRYDNVSAEVAFNLDRNGKVWSLAFTALALLGVNLPAVAGLKPLHKHFDFGFLKLHKEQEAYSVALPADGEQSIYIDLPPGVTPEEMREAIASLSTNPDEESDMDQKEVERIAAEAAKKAADAAETKLRAEYDQKLAAEKTAREEAEKKLRESQENFAAESRQRASTEFAARCIVPALRPSLIVAHSLAAKAPATETFDIGTFDEQKKPKKVGAIDALNSLIDTINGMAKQKLFSVDAGKPGGGKDVKREHGAVDFSDKKAVSDEVARLVEEHMKKPENAKVSYDDAVIAVLAGDSELKAAYAAA